MRDLQRLVEREIGRTRLKCDFRGLAGIIDAAMLELERARIPINRDGDTFKYSVLGCRFRSVVDNGKERVILFIDSDLPGDPRFAHLYASGDDDSVINPGICYGTLAHRGLELVAEEGRSERNYSGEEIKEILEEAVAMVQRTGWGW